MAQELFENVAKHADDEYKGKTILFCWEHKTIPLIVDAFGLNPLDEPLYWGSNPEAEVCSDYQLNTYPCCHVRVMNQMNMVRLSELKVSSDACMLMLDVVSFDNKLQNRC